MCVKVGSLVSLGDGTDQTGSHGVTRGHTGSAITILYTTDTSMNYVHRTENNTKTLPNSFLKISQQEIRLLPIISTFKLTRS